jgi:hypothetical protein
MARISQFQFNMEIEPLLAPNRIMKKYRKVGQWEAEKE